MASLIQVRRGTHSSWNSANPVLSAGEVAFSTDNGKIKIGDGSTAWASLPYAHYTQAEVTALLVSASAAAYASASAYTDSRISNVIDAAPGALDTLNELAAALGDDSNFAGTVTTALGTKLTIVAASATYLTKVSASSTYDTFGSAGSALNAANVHADGAVFSHNSASTSIHGIEDVGLLATKAWSETRLASLSATYDPLGSATAAGASALYAANFYTDSEFNSLSTTDISEGTKLFFTDQRAAAAALATVQSASAYSLAQATSYADGQTTDNIAEGANKYFTNQRALDATISTIASASAAAVSYADGLTTADIAENTNLYFTNQRALDATVSTISSASAAAVTSASTAAIANSLVTIASASAAAVSYADSLTTADVAENTNLYFTNQRALDATSSTIASASAAAVSNSFATIASASAAAISSANGYTNSATSTFEALPNKTGNDGKYLTTNSGVTSWATVDLSTKQPLDADLTAIAGLSGTSGYLKKTASDTWSLDTNTFIDTSATSQSKAGNMTFDGTLTVNNLVVSGSAAIISASVMEITDPLIYLSSQQYDTDSVDIGIFGAYGDVGAGHWHTGLVRDASDSKWKLVSGASGPTANVVDFGTATYDTLQIGALEVSSSAIVTNLNADYLDGNNAAYFASAADVSALASASTNYQPVDGDLTAIAAISGTSGLLKKTSANTWSLDTNTYLTGNQTVTVSGDASGSGETSINLTLANSGVTAATYGSASAIPVIAVDSKGRVTSVTTSAVVSLPTQTGNNGKYLSTDGSTASWTTLDLSLKADVSSPTLTGTPAAPTAAADTNTTQIATTAFVIGQGYAKLASPTLTGTPAAPTASVDTNTTQIATTAFVMGQSYLTSTSASTIYAPLASPTFTGTVSASVANFTGAASGIAPSASANFATKAYVDSITANAQTASYTLVLADTGKAIEMNVGSGNNLTVPPNSSVAFPVGITINIVQYGAGKTTVVAGAGVTIRSKGSLYSINGQYASASLYKRATDEWVLLGDLIA